MPVGPSPGWCHGAKKRSHAALVPDDNTRGALVTVGGSDGSTVSTQGQPDVPEPYGFQWYVGATRRSVNDPEGTIGSIAVVETIVSRRDLVLRASDWPAVWDNGAVRSWGGHSEAPRASVPGRFQRSKVAVDGMRGARVGGSACSIWPACLREERYSVAGAQRDAIKISDGVRVQWTT